MSERILFLPWGWGGGAGYTARCLALAERLRAAGDHVAFADCGASALVADAGFPLLAQETSALRRLESRRVPPYLPFADVERVFAVAAGYHRIGVFRRQLEADAASIREFRPTIVVIDMSPTGSLAARAAGLPVVSLADADFVTAGPNPWMPWLRGSPLRVLPHPSCLPVLDSCSRQLRLGPVRRAEDLLWGDLTLIPSVPELEPVHGRPLRGHLHHIGPLYWNPPGQAVGALPRTAGRRRVYVTIGSGGMVGTRMLQAVVDACAGQPWDVVIATGYAFAGDLHVPGNVTLVGFAGLDEPLAWADVVLSHGGYSTVIASLAHGRPSVVLPFMSEQEMNGRQLVEGSGSGVLLRTSTVDDAGRVHLTDRYHGPAGDPSAVPVASVRAAITEVLATPAMAANAGRCGARLRAAAAAVDLVGLVHGAR